jgi:hypothetical protein
MIGPALPPGFQRKVKNEKESLREVLEAKSAPVEDDYGPPLPVFEGDEEREERERKERLEAIEARLKANPPKPSIKVTKETTLKREDWMTKPPQATIRSVGPQLKSRQFSMKSGQDTIDQSIWTAAPEDREKARIETAKRELDVIESEKQKRARDIADSHNVRVVDLSR